MFRRWFVLGWGLFFVAMLIGPLPGRAQNSDLSGVCDGNICGPSGAFTVAEFPTISGLDFTAFPITRPYEPAEGGREWYVATDGDDNADGTESAPLASPERAIEMAASGDVIWVMDGEYAVGLPDEYEALRISTPNLILAAQHPGAVIFRPAGSEHQVGIAAVADDLIIDGLALSGFHGVSILFGRLDTPQHNLILQHLILEGSPEALRSEIPETSPHSQPIIDGLLAYDVWLRDITGIGFNCGEGPCDNMRLEAVVVEMASEDDMASAADAIAVESGDNILVFNAEVTGAGADGIDLKATRATVANVDVHDIGRNGIKLWQGGDVINALVINTGADTAIAFEHGARYRVLHSIVARHAWPERAYAMTTAYDYQDEAGQLEIINSVFFENNGAAWVSLAFELTLTHNLFYSASVEWRDMEAGNGIPFANIEAASGGCCNLSFDPLFTDPDAGDYTVASDSPLINVGTVDVEAYVPFDLYGNSRQENVDLGPVEIQ